MHALSTNFLSAKKDLIGLYNTVNKFTFRNEENQKKALETLKKINSAFKLSKIESYRSTQISLEELSELNDRLITIQSRVTRKYISPPPIFNSPSKENQLEMEREIRGKIAKIRNHLVTISLNSQNQEFKNLLDDLKKTAKLVSSNIKNIQIEYSLSAVNTGNPSLISMAVANNLKRITNVLVRAGSFAEDMNRTLVTENFDTSTWPKTEMESLRITLNNFFDEFTKLSNSAAYFGEEIDLVRYKIVYEPDTFVETKSESFFDSANYEEVCNFYKTEITKCKKEIESLMQYRSESTIAVLQAVSHLSLLLNMKDSYMKETEAELVRELEVCETLLGSRNQTLFGLEEIGVAPHDELQNECLSLELMCVAADKDLQKFQEAFESPEFNQAEEFICFMEDNSIYKNYIGVDQFVEPIYPPQGHWLLAPARPRDDEAIETLIEAFNKYSFEIFKLKDLLKINSKSSVLRSFMALNQKIESMKRQKEMLSLDLN